MVAQLLEEVAEEGVEFRFPDIASPLAEEEAAPDGFEERDGVVAVKCMAQDVTYRLFEAVQVGTDFMGEVEAAEDDASQLVKRR